MSDHDTPAEAQPLPLDEWHRARGARMVPFAGYAMPVQYTGPGGGIVAEHEWTRSHAGLFDVSHMGQLLLSGERAEAALEALLPIDLRTLEPGAPRYSLLLDEDAGIIDDLIVARWEDGFFIVVNGATKHGDIAHFEERLPAGATLRHLEDRALLALQGPAAFAVLDRHATGATPLSTLSFMRGAHFTLAGTAAWISRTGYTGEDGFEISIPSAKAASIAELLCSEPEVHPIGLGARDSLRLEAGLPLYGHDLDRTTDPVSAGLGWAIARRRRAEGGFPGHAPIARLVEQGPAWRRVGLSFDGRLPAREGAPLFAGDAEVGRVTSGGFSPTLGRPIAMAYVDAAHAAPGTPLTAEVRGRRLEAAVTPLPFVPHRYHRQGASR
ncbi:aminomethyltransferase [Altererythrobacter sp. B11]|uniref:glycine cleavage system aminomethyltransferase GcvT n=1 Tax=Altererythrobacter sp. B11 TaxID=2060312 RepID=UPI000DC6D2A8|nr:glycine cleavage system aminomethyltransferase GcvT [Altererythrobacter sp. B11]BBC74267.1 aminomethyltransferase [Altererythrobacter sp. B11]